MADTLREAFADRRSPLAANASDDSADILVAPQPAAIMLVDSLAEAAAPLAPPSAAVLSISSRQWLVVSERDTPAPLMAHLTAPHSTEPDLIEPGDESVVTDLSHARFRIRVQGPKARDILQSGIAIDLRDAAFPQGHSAPVAFRDIAVVLHAEGNETFDLYVFRSYALSLWEWLADAARQV